jgi:hypothetical protein
MSLPYSMVLILFKYNDTLNFQSNTKQNIYDVYWYIYIYIYIYTSIYWIGKFSVQNLFCFISLTTEQATFRCRIYCFICVTTEQAIFQCRIYSVLYLWQLNRQLFSAESILFYIFDNWTGNFSVQNLFCFISVKTKLLRAKNLNFVRTYICILFMVHLTSSCYTRLKDRINEWLQRSGRKLSWRI